MNDELSLDVALDIIGTLRALKIKEMINEVDPVRKEQLSKEENMYAAEEKAIYTNDEIRDSIIDKALRLYGPILKQKYASV